MSSTTTTYSAVFFARKALVLSDLPLLVTFLPSFATKVLLLAPAAALLLAFSTIPFPLFFSSAQGFLSFFLSCVFQLTPQESSALLFLRGLGLVSSVSDLEDLEYDTTCTSSSMICDAMRCDKACCAYAALNNCTFSPHFLDTTESDFLRLSLSLCLSPSLSDSWFYHFSTVTKYTFQRTPLPGRKLFLLINYFLSFLFDLIQHTISLLHSPRSVTYSRYCISH